MTLLNLIPEEQDEIWQRRLAVFKKQKIRLTNQHTVDPNHGNKSSIVEAHNDKKSTDDKNKQSTRKKTLYDIRGIFDSSDDESDSERDEKDSETGKHLKTQAKMEPSPADASNVVIK